MKKIDGLGFLDYLKERLLILDGATGTFLQKNGMGPGVCPELFALENQAVLRDVQRRYIDAGARAVYTCTLGGSAKKLEEFGLQNDAPRINRELAEISAGVAGERAFVGGDVSSTGAFLAPLGDLKFEDAVDIFKEQIRALVQGGVDFIAIETMIDIQEARAAVIAAREACSLPVVASMTFDARGRTLTGTSPAAAAIALICAGADVVGLNCSTGPGEMLPYVLKMKEVATVPLIVKPNAGMPRLVDGRTVFDLGCGEFRKYVKPLCAAGANLIGGCCGTDPDYIRAIVQEAEGLRPRPWRSALPAVVTSMRDEVLIGGDFRVIGERINPTGKPKLRQAVLSGDFDAVLDIALEQKDSGAHILDVNMGVPGTDERAAMNSAIELLSAQVKLPLCIDSSSAEVIGQALRIYPGRALVNSLSTKAAHLKTLLPLIKRYKPMFILLPIGDSGIPKTAGERIAEIKKGYKKLKAAGIGKESVLVDGLVMAISSDPQAALETLGVIKWCSENGFRTVLGISNGSFGLPERGMINSAYLVMAMANGLSAAILNPGDKQLTDLRHAAEALTARDVGLGRYLKRFAGVPPAEDAGNVYDAVLIGKKKAVTALIDAQIAQGKTADEIINGMIVPALHEVGARFERRKYFLPQLIYSAETARSAFDYLEKHFVSADARTKKKVVIATVQGDIHDIGKNLVAMLLRNHGFEVIDLGKDVPAEVIVDAADAHSAHIIALSALITTTAREMEKVIALTQHRGLSAKVLVGGAVITEDYAGSIGADGYAPDAAGAVIKASQLLE